MANVFSDSRPLHGEGKQTELHRLFEDYAHGAHIQNLMQEMLMKLFVTRPEDPIPFMIAFLEAKQTPSFKEESE